MRKTKALLFALTIGATGSYAQQIAKEDRFGHGEDSIKCLQNISMYTDHIKTKNYAEAYEPWKDVFYNHPAARINMYDDGATILRALIKAETDATKKEALVQELLGTYDRHVEYLDAVNAFRKTPLTKASILAKKSHDYIVYVKPLDAAKAHTMLLEIVNMDPENASTILVQDLMNVSSSIAKKKEEHKEQMIKDYLLTSEIAAKSFEKAKENAAKGGANAEAYEKLATNWEKVKGNIDGYFINSGAANAESLQTIYAPQVEANKENAEFLKQVIVVMGKIEGGRDQEAYMNAAEYVHLIEPTAASAAGCANRYFKKGETEKAIEFMEQAIELETDDTEKSKHCYKTAQLLNSIKQFSKAKSYANKAISLNANYGAPYILIGAMYASNIKWHDEAAMNKCVYYAAIDKFQRAKNVDPSCAEEANKLINTYSAHTPKPEDLFFLGYKKGDNVNIGGWIGETVTIR
ncbi:MAG: hypothetical protein IKU98_05875 [Bacteroidaceae bacterium]|nr:hypothetical protein [Bacteroidaceae bacterium]